MDKDGRYIRRARWVQPTFDVDKCPLLSLFREYCTCSANANDTQQKNKLDISELDKKTIDWQRDRMPTNVAKFLRFAVPSDRDLPVDAFELVQLLINCGPKMITRYMLELQNHAYSVATQNIYLHAISEFSQMLNEQLSEMEMPKETAADPGLVAKMNNTLTRWGMFASALADKKKKKKRQAKHAGHHVRNEEFLDKKNLWLSQADKQVPHVVR